RRVFVVLRSAGQIGLFFSYSACLALVEYEGHFEGSNPARFGNHPDVTSVDEIEVPATKFEIEDVGAQIYMDRFSLTIEKTRRLGCRKHNRQLGARHAAVSSLAREDGDFSREACELNLGR